MSSREVLDLFARLVSICEHGGSAPEVRARIRSFLLYAAWHFAGEEAYMDEARYPAYLEHKADHLRLLLEAEHFVASLGNVMTATARTAIVGYFENWLVYHKVGHDRQLGDFRNDMMGRLPPAT